MAKLNKEELISKISERIEDIDLANELLEDISDSIDFDDSDLRYEIESLKSELLNQKQKYKDRFMGKVTEEETIEKQDDEVIDVKELNLDLKSK